MSKAKDEVTIDISNYVRSKLDAYQVDGMGEQYSNQDLDNLIRGLVAGDIKELGGLTALRGFFYQYLVAMNYMVDMIYIQSDAWWDAVIFELLDDVVLVSEQRVRFVQVKTGREDAKHRIEPSDLYSRTNGLNSWLDTLFLNLPEYLQRQNTVGRNLQIGEEEMVQFEIATNLPQEHKNYLAPYFDNYEYSLSEEDKHDNDKLFEKLNKPQNIVRKVGQRNQVVDTKMLVDELSPLEISWYLKRLHIRSLGYFEQLEGEIKYKIATMLSKIEEVLKPSVIEIILQRLLSKIVARTHQDGPSLKKQDLVFTRDELELWFQQWTKEAIFLVYQAGRSGTLGAHFETCCEELRDFIRQEWVGEPQRELIAIIDWIQLQLSDRVRQGSDIDAYEKFLNRLFEMKNSRISFSLNGTRERQYLMNSLQNMAVCLSFYKDHRFVYDEAALLFKKGQSLSDTNTFVTYNARKQDEFDTVKRRIAQTAKSCPETQRIKDDYYCIIVDPKEDMDEGTDPFASLKSIAAGDRSQAITDEPNNIRFVKYDKMNQIINSLKGISNDMSLQDKMVFEIWKKTLQDLTRGGD